VTRNYLRTARRIASHAADLAGVSFLLAVCILGFPSFTVLFALGLVCLAIGWGLDR
jgi:uncharacterized membrane protein